MSYSPCGRKESDTTERLHFFFLIYLDLLFNQCLYDFMHVYKILHRAGCKHLFLSSKNYFYCFFFPWVYTQKGIPENAVSG